LAPTQYGLPEVEDGTGRRGDAHLVRTQGDITDIAEVWERVQAKEGRNLCKEGKKRFAGASVRVTGDHSESALYPCIEVADSNELEAWM